MDYLQYSKEYILDFYSQEVLNLIINGLPSILFQSYSTNNKSCVLNLIINGLPSILSMLKHMVEYCNQLF